MTQTAVSEAIVDRIREGHRPSIAQAISLLEARHPGFVELGEAVWQAGGQARVIGITGAPGSGKSTLANAFVGVLRARGRRVGIIAVDPSSSISGGAILGDRIRMSGHTGDDGVFVRSLSTRGSLGGLSRAAIDAVAVLDAAGFDDVVVETVGVGQAEVDIVKIAHSVLVVSVPGLGDDIQMIKAGLIELADIHVVNKADRADVNKLVSEIKSMLTLAHTFHSAGWVPPVVETISTKGSGIPELVDAVDAHTTWLNTTGEIERTRMRTVEVRIREIAKELLVESIQDPARGGPFAELVVEVESRQKSPYVAARSLVAGDAIQ
jgi:LAO/AO transport system kinase